MSDHSRSPRSSAEPRLYALWLSFGIKRCETCRVLLARQSFVSYR
ncbi:hypothetical protein HMPREF1527_01295 [Atopobium sp. oral taxon 199 str. F0494]|nr:hypothetical protein HMPREF1527_01295 [Atopobium sp. oral taxon 199 str. F0494]